MKKLLDLYLVFFLCWIAAPAQIVDLNWAKQIGASSYERPVTVDVDKYGNVYTVGTFNSTCDFDPGPAIYNLYTGSGNVFIQKLDSNGNFIWAKSFQNQASSNLFLKHKIDTSGNLFLYGSFSYTIDADPGPGVFNLYANGSQTALIIKLDSAANFLWANSLGGGGFGFYSSIDFDSSGSIFATGYFAGANVDFDPGPGVFYLNSTNTNQNYRDFFIQKLDKNGNFMWAKVGGSNKDDEGNDITIDKDGNCYITGSFKDTADFDPGPGIALLNSLYSSPTIFILKLNSAGDYQWAKKIDGTNYAYATGIKSDHDKWIYFNGSYAYGQNPPFTGQSYDVYVGKIDTAGNINWIKTTSSNEVQQTSGLDIDKYGNTYTIGNFAGGAEDFDPGLGSFLIPAASSTNICMLKLDAFGNFLWAVGFDGNSDEQSSSIKVDNFGNVYSCGFFSNLFDADPGNGALNFTSAGFFDGYILKLKQGPCANFSVTIDSLVEYNCSDSGFAVSYPLFGKEPYAYSWNTIPARTDSFIVFKQGGIYQLQVTDANACVKTTALIANGPKFVSGMDLNINSATTEFNSSFPIYVWLSAFNDGCVNASGTLKLIPTSSLTYQSANPPPTNIVGDTLMWDFNNMNYYTPPLTPQVSFSATPGTALGSVVCFTAIITPFAGDSDTSNNRKTFCSALVGSYDPNTKSVYPEGACEEGYVLPNNSFTYTIHFQNTGNAQAYNILVMDSLSQNLNLNTLRILGSSHLCQLETSSNNVVGFRFNNIFLPDSATNEPMSHGYVIFEAYPLNGLPSGTEIKNRVAIIFDNNPPVLTNQVRNTLVTTVPTCITGFENALENESFSIFPNPSNRTIYLKSASPGEIKIVDTFGKECMRVKINRTVEIDISSLSNGVYFIQAPQGNYCKLVKQ